MTRQIANRLTYRGAEYYIGGVDLGFVPRGYGIETTAPNTACWRGWWAEFYVVGLRLVLENLHVYNRSGIYPELLNGSKLRRSSYEMPCYRWVNLPVRYTGKVLAYAEIIQGCRIPPGVMYLPPSAFERVLRLDFEDGMLVNKGVEARNPERVQRQGQRPNEAGRGSSPGLLR